MRTDERGRRKERKKENEVQYGDNQDELLIASAAVVVELLNGIYDPPLC